MTHTSDHDTTRRFDGLDWQQVPLWKDVTPEQWHDYKWQLSHQLRNAADVARLMPLSPEAVEGIEAALGRFRMAITPYYASLIDPDDPFDPVLAQAVPSGNEAVTRATDLADPLSEDEDSPTPHLTHRYPDRVLMLVTEVCSMYCRHCTRRRKVGEHDCDYNREAVLKQLEYIRRTPQVKDVLISGGDPLVMPTDRLRWVLEQVRAIDHVEIIRIGSRVPVVMPMRITDELADMLKQFHPLYINTHFNHPREVTPLSAAACAKLADAGIPLGNQTVLLNGVNDNPYVMRKLMRKLLTIRVKPYYIFQCDLSEGIGHFRTPVSAGIQIIESLRGHISGLGVPTFVVDAPSGGGKVPVMPNYVVSWAPNEMILRNFEGTICRYSEEPDYVQRTDQHPESRDETLKPKEGPALMMLDTDMLTIGPTPERKRRINPKP